ncbi:MAG: hypothetical protein A2255_02350 [Candidatus Melainabacteria bacterium RIFOXYA2_FULL_32_9]|nr:MAG: hypothetical protein A2255_02350 [Candidatus Melainabacteria bacterium RIFOXYA2_FULL_32_9]
MTKKNSMGSDVVEGFACKPKELDKNKPIMFSAVQIFICDGHRCQDEETSDNLADKIRDIIKELGYDKGENRVKVTRTYCNGACRFRKFAYAYKNANTANFTPEQSFSAWKRVHEWTDDQWKELIISLVEGKEPESLKNFRVEDKIYDE